jgi:hypothetical protein
MKKLLFLFSALLFISCSGDDNDSSSNSDDTNAVDLSTFKNGVYLFQLYRSDTKEWVNKRVVKSGDRE